MIAALLAITVVAVAAWMIYDEPAETESVAPPEITQLIDDYLRAWEELDKEALQAAVTLDFVINEYYYEDATTRVFMIEHIVDDLEGALNTGLNPARQWQTEQVGEPIITGDGPWFVSVRENWILEKSRGDGMATYVIVEDGGTLKIANHYWAGLHYRTSL
jgi:uncharacterized protein (DUF2164 family)